MIAPKVSIGLPVYNGELYVAEAIQSVINQDFDDFELVISDNASTDRTQEICQDYASNDKRIRYHRNAENIGSSPNYNRTFQLACGEYFKWLAHDDRCCPGFLSRCMDVMRSAPTRVAIVYPQCDLINDAGNVFERVPREPANTFTHPHRRLIHVLRNVGYAYPLWGLIRSSHLRRTRLLAGGSLDDYVLLAELALEGEFWELPDALFELRMHMSNAWAVCSREQGDIAWRENAKANRQSRQRMLAWTDPSLAHKRLWLPFYEDLYLRYLKGVHHAHLGILEKLLCYLTVPVVCYFRRTKNYAAVWKRRLLSAVAAPRGREAD